MNTSHRIGAGGLILVGFLSLTAQAQVPRALEAGKLPEDSRLGALRTLEDYFPFTPVESADAWKERAQQLRRQVLVATGLWPAPTRTELKPVIHGRVNRGEYTVEKVYFESFPGHYVSGSLYRPVGRSGPLPVVLCPHGHWSNGRFHDHGAQAVRNEIASGAERFEVSGRYPLQSRCVQLARMGCIVFFYDMIGYADSVQIAHRPGVRKEMNQPDQWGFFSPQAEARLENMMGLQTWNSIRALDFVLSLPDVDPKRVAVTGASGGGTQTFILAAIDDRPTVLVPAVMVSTAMQGGCTCENAPYLRVGAGNIDLAGVAAPRPQFLTAADDWTIDLQTKGMPDLANLYQMLGAKDSVGASYNVHFGHNYNSVSRMIMYNWVNRHFNLGYESPILEREFSPLSREEHSVWNAQHPAPAGDRAGDVHEKALLQWWNEDTAKQLTALSPADEATLGEFHRVVGGAWRVLLGLDLRQGASPEHELAQKLDKGDYLLMTGLIRNKEKSEAVPALWFYPKEKWNEQVVVWVHEKGKAGLMQEDGSPTPGVAGLLKAGFAVAGLDLLFQGEFLEKDEPYTTQRIVPYDKGEQPWQQFAGYTFGYNHSLLAQRVHDILGLIKFTQTDKRTPKQIHLVGLGPVAGPIAAAARWSAGESIGKTVIDTGAFRFESLDRFDHAMFVPGAVKYLDLPGLLALSAPHPLWLADSGPGLEVVKAAYAAAGQAEAMVVYEGTPENIEAEALKWIKQ